MKKKQKIHPLSIYTELLEFAPPISLTKSGIADHAKDIISHVEKGNVTALDAATNLAYIAEVCKQAREGIKEYAYDETGKWNGLERVEVNGATVSRMNSVKYDYSNCNDVEWNEYQRQMEVLKEKISQRETFLKTLHNTLTIADEETGEMITLNPPVKQSEPTIKISFPSK